MRALSDGLLPISAASDFSLRISTLFLRCQLTVPAKRPSIAAGLWFPGSRFMASRLCTGCMSRGFHGGHWSPCQLLNGHGQNLSHNPELCALSLHRRTRAINRRIQLGLRGPAEVARCLLQVGADDCGVRLAEAHLPRRQAVKERNRLTVEPAPNQPVSLRQPYRKIATSALPVAHVCVISTMDLHMALQRQCWPCQGHCPCHASVVGLQKG